MTVRCMRGLEPTVVNNASYRAREGFELRRWLPPPIAAKRCEELLPQTPRKLKLNAYARQATIDDVQWIAALQSRIGVAAGDETSNSQSIFQSFPIRGIAPTKVDDRLVTRLTVHCDDNGCRVDQDEASRFVKTCARDMEIGVTFVLQAFKEVVRHVIARKCKRDL